MIKEHPGLFVLFVLGYGVASVAHSLAAVEYAKTHKRPAFEGFALFLLLLTAWPLFSFGMMCRGYADFWDKTWGNEDDDGQA